MGTIRDHTGKRVTFRASNRTLTEAVNARTARMPPEERKEPDDLRVFDYRAKEPRWEAVVGFVELPVVIAACPAIIVGGIVWLGTIMLLYALPAIAVYALGADWMAVALVAIATCAVAIPCSVKSRQLDLADNLLRLGHCGACGYKLEPAEGEGSLTVCPECGAAWRKHVKARDATPQFPSGTSD